MKSILFLIVAYTMPLLAYLDPGTGSMLLYFIVGIFTTIIYFMKNIFYKFKSIIFGGYTKKSLSNLTDQNIDILFYSEGGQYWNVFLPIIEELEKLQIKSAYYTSKKNDYGLQSNFKYLQVKYIGSNQSTFALLNRIKVKIMVMTTPQLDVMYLKRSKHVKHYIHLVHAASETILYKKFAFDYFDSIMCSGELQLNNIKILLEKRGFYNKKYFQTGLTYYDIMFRNRLKYKRNFHNKTILIAPSWGKNSLLVKYGTTPIEILLKAGFNIILRPHPQMYISQKKIIAQIEQKIEAYNNIVIDKKPSGEESMAISDILISDFSGIIYDYYLIYEKPIVVFLEDISIAGLEAEDIDTNIIKKAIFHEFVYSVNSKELDRLDKIVINIIGKDIEQSKIDKIRKKMLYNFPKSGRIAANQILQLREEL